MTKHTYLIGILAVILFAFALRLWHVDSESIWHDEGWSIRAIRGPFTTPDDNTPFLYYLTGHVLWRAGAGETPLALRYISVLIGTLTAALALRISGRWLGPLAGLCAGLLVAASPLLWEYAQEVRAYVAVPLLALLLLAGADAILKRRRGEAVPLRLWAFVFVVELAALYTHNLAVPLVIWLNAALGMVWLLRRDWRRMATWAGLQITLIVAYIPWLLTQSPSGTPLNTPPQPGAGLLIAIWQSYFLPALPQLQAAPANLTVMLSIMGIVVAIMTLFASIHRWIAPTRVWLIASHALLVPAFSTALMLAANIDFHPRYYIAAVPGTLMLLVLSRRSVVTIGLTAVTVAVSVYSLHQITTTRAYQHDDFRELAAYYATLPADAVILIPFEAERALQDYYADALNIRAQFVNIPLYSDEETALETINQLAQDGQRHVELLTWFQLPADPRGMYPCLLTAAHVGEAAPETRFYFGLSTQQYEIVPLTLQPLALSPDYAPITLEAGAYATSSAGTCVRTQWRLAQPVNAALNVAVSALNPLDSVIARSDADIANSKNVGTSRWAVHDSGAAYNLLTLPEHAPQMGYDLTLNVYSDAQPSGLDLLDTAGNPAGKVYTMPDTLTLSGPAGTLPATPQLLSDNVEDTIETRLPFDATLLLPEGEHMVLLAINDAVAADAAHCAPTHINAAGAVPCVGPMNTTEDTTYPGGLAWVRFIVPPGTTGEAVLMVDDTEIARYPLVDVPRITEQPPIEQSINVQFPGVATLVGVQSLDLPQVTLVWRAEDRPEADYTVFVQLLGAEGQVVAQSDAQPPRPTGSWVTGEYIVDTHTLRYNLPDYDGETTLIAGFYNPATFERVSTVDGATFTTIR